MWLLLQVRSSHIYAALTLWARSRLKARLQLKVHKARHHIIQVVTSLSGQAERHAVQGPSKRNATCLNVLPCVHNIQEPEYPTLTPR